MMLTGDLITGTEAHRIGLVSEICEDGAATVDRAVELAQTIASNEKNCVS